MLRYRRDGRYLRDGLPSPPSPPVRYWNIPRPESPQPPVQRSPPPMSLCEVCLEDKPLVTVTRPLLVNHTHSGRICYQCLQRSIQIQVADKKWDKIQCPICMRRLEGLDMQQWADTTTYTT